MLTVNLMVCRKCQQVFSLTAGATCPMCSSDLFMVEFSESGPTPAAPDECDLCGAPATTVKVTHYCAEHRSL